MKANVEVFQNAYLEYVLGQISLRKVSKKYGINYNTFYLFVKKEQNLENKRNYGGRKKIYTEEVLQKAFLDIEKGIEISLVASKYDIKKNTLRNYYSLYKSKNEKIKTNNKTIKKLKAQKENNKENNLTEPANNVVELLKNINYKKVNDNVIEVEYISSYDELPEEFSDVNISFSFNEETGLKMNLAFLVIIFGKRNPIAAIIYNELNNYRKIENYQEMYQSPYREWFQQDYFHVNSVLEALRRIKANISVIEEIKNIYMFIKDNKAIIEKLFLKSN